MTSSPLGWSPRVAPLSIRHNVDKAAERWIQVTLIKGKRIDVCKVLANCRTRS